MGFLKKLANTAINAVVEGAKTGFMSGLASGLRGQNPLNSDDYNAEFYALGDAVMPHNKTSINTYTDLADKSRHKNELVDDGYLTSLNSGFLKLSNVIAEKPKNEFESFNQKVVYKEYKKTGFELRLPSWGYDSFIHERAIWQKGLQSPFGEPGYFYFKIFFDFDTQNGLFGGILNDEDIWQSNNSAGKYLKMLESSGRYSVDLISDRLVALEKFTNILSYINCSAPWFFRGIRGLDKALLPVQKDFSKERILEIECSVESIDMRLSTLLDLYNFACFDNINDREIIPENLRKFNMMIMIFNSPIKHLHTPTSNNPFGTGAKKTSTFISGLKKLLGVKNNGNALGYKSIGTDYKNFPTCKIFSFYNCEFVQDTLGSAIPSTVNNEEPFQLGKNTISIQYGECLGYNMNEFNSFMFGSDGIYFNDYILKNPSFVVSANAKDRQVGADEQEKMGSFVNRLADTLNKPQTYSRFDKDFMGEKGIPDIDSYEQFAHNNLSSITSYGFGNLYGSKATKPNSQYYNAKVKFLAGKPNAIAEMGVNLIGKLLGSQYRSSQKLGFLPGYGERAVGSAYWKAKIEKLKQGHPSQKNGQIYDLVNFTDRAKRFNLRDTLIQMSR